MIKRWLDALWKWQYKLPIHLHKEYWVDTRGPNPGWMNHEGMQLYKRYTAVAYMIVVKKKGKVK